MAKFVFAMNQSLDGYIDHDAFEPPPGLFAHFIQQTAGLSGSVYGRIMYETMRYWDEDRPEWGAAEHDYAAAWRGQPKWVVSRTLDSVGPNATLISEDVEAAVRRVKSAVDGDVLVAGPMLAASLPDLIDEYQIYLHPAVVGGGKTFFAKARPPLRLVRNEPIEGSVIRLTYVPA